MRDQNIDIAHQQTDSSQGASSTECSVLSSWDLPQTSSRLL